MAKIKISQFALINGICESDVREKVMAGEYFASFHNGGFVIHTYPDGRPKPFQVGKPRWVYFIHDEWRNATKIGATSTIPSRMQQLQVGNPCELKALAFFQYSDQHIATIVENLAKKHCYRGAKHILGEWFDGSLIPDSVIDAVTSEYTFAKQNQLTQFVFDSPKSYLEYITIFN